MAYPIFLNVKGKRALVVGGGKVAFRKARSLAEEGAAITVVSPMLIPEFYELAEKGLITWLQKPFSPADLSDAFLIFAATDSRETNEAVKRAASACQIVNIADDPDGSDFHVPASLKRGRLQVAISSGGASPLLAKRIRDEIAKELDEGYGETAEFLYRCRQTVLIEIKAADLRKEILHEIAEEDFYLAADREQKFEALLSLAKSRLN